MRLDGRLLGDLRSDHAGELGAVAIYDGILAVSRDPGVRAFAARHRATEADHLARIVAVLPPGGHSRLAPLWRVAGFLTGVLPALVGPRAVYLTIAAVERFVDGHYQEQIDAIGDRADLAELKALLVACQADERHHRDDAAALAGAPPGPIGRLWGALVGGGSAAAVVAARRI
jgi:ubiquinone biosynthesis monooxygenase Coq7